MKTLLLPPACRIRQVLLWPASTALSAVVACIASCISFHAAGQTYVTPKMGGGQTPAEMVHIDVYYDQNANTLHANVDDSYGIPELRPLEPETAFDPASPWGVLNEKAYNAQYGWNVGGFFNVPIGAAIWVELTDASPELETYEGSGKLGSYLPIFGTESSPLKWRWSGVMVHNTYAVSKPTRDRLFAEYLVYFGDEVTGGREGFMEYDDTQVRLEWTTESRAPPFQLLFGAADLTNGAPLMFLNATNYSADSEFIVNFTQTSPGVPYVTHLPMRAVAATVANGGPVAYHAALGSCLEIEMVSFTGPRGGRLGICEEEGDEPLFEVLTGTQSGTNRIRLTTGVNSPAADPGGCFEPGRLTLSQAGLYTLGFRVVDTSTNGPAAGPIHASSDLYRMYLQAGHSIASLAVAEGVARVTFGGISGRTFYLERSTHLEPNPDWELVAGPLTGEDRLQSLSNTPLGGASVFYRLLSGAIRK